ncbi:MAG: class I adenylate-forming enzyme family protein [Bacillota bacterium]|nr:class I adenylate-forming enzyme family protein [Bacillota bacterium]
MKLYDFLKLRMLNTPNKTISDEVNTITYQEILNYAESFSQYLTHNKYGILCKSELNTAKVLMACLNAGVTAVLLSDRYGEIHTQKIIEKINIQYIISDNFIEEVKAKNTESEDLSDVALIMCTSGTTGSPKGAMITDENIITNLSDIEDYFEINSSDKILIARPLYHCAVLTGEFFISLIKGLDIVFHNTEFNPVKIVQAIYKNNITVMCGTPTLFYHLCNIAKRQTETLPLKTIAISGECMTDSVAEIIKNTMPQIRAYNVYGLTEASPRVSYLAPDNFDKNPLSVGVPLKSLEVKIVDNELLVKGKSVMKGYYNDVQATRKVIIDGWLHTGDIAKIDGNGFINIKSRKDNMIIRAGMNIYPQEIENALKQDERIIDLLAYGVKDEKVGQKIYLKIVSDQLSKSEVFEICKMVLPPYQYPDSIEFVDEIPKNASGKVIRSYL